MRAQRGFTLLELMIAMAIFAALAVIGWQVFDSVNRARERAQRHADHLAVLQYAYLQLQQDIGQIIAYQAAPVEGASGVDNLATNSDNAQVSTAKPFMSLDGEQMSLVRFADPDPRYQTSPSIQRVDYIFADQRLIRRQYTSIDGGNESISLDTVLLDGVTASRWNAYLPELSPKFPNLERQNSIDNSTNTNSTQANNSAADKAEIVLLPKGISVSFSYQEMPITWQFAVAPQPVAKNNNTGNNGNANNNTGNNNAPENSPNLE